MSQQVKRPSLYYLTSGKTTPSSRYRVFQFAPHLQADGFPCRIANSFPEKYEYFRWLGWRGSRLLKRLVRRWHLQQIQWARPDVVILERELFDEPTWEIEDLLRKCCRRLVLDIDDAVFLRYPEKMQHLAKICDGVIAGNSRLEAWFRPLARRVVHIPTCVDLAKYPPLANRSPPMTPVIGWIGTPTNLPELNVVIPALKALSESQKFCLRLISKRQGEFDQLDFGSIAIDWVEWSPETAIQSLRTCDIGIMPLDSENPWNEYKCGLKLIEYLALGLPVVASPVGVNSEIVVSGENGFLATNNDQWAQSLKRLLDDFELRQEFGRRARQTASERYSVQAWLPRLEQELTRFAFND